MKRFSDESFADYKKRQKICKNWLKEHSKGRLIHISKRTLSEKEKGIVYKKET